MLIVVSYPSFVSDEAAAINSLFEAGMEIFHLRKPTATSEELEMLLRKIRPVFYDRIALHGHHHHAEQFGVRRLHYNAAQRVSAQQDFLRMRDSGKLLSTSIHSLAAHNDSLQGFEYVLFGPVFDSISKPGYKAMAYNGGSFEFVRSSAKVIAIGGITPLNIGQAMQRGFHGVATLGYIWESVDPVKAFLTCKKVFSECAVMR